MECSVCGGTGFSGDVMDLLDPQYAVRSPRRPSKVKPKDLRELYEIAISAVLEFQTHTNKRK